MSIFESIATNVYIVFLALASIVNLYGVYALVKDKEKPNKYALISFTISITLFAMTLKEILNNYYYVNEKYIYALNIITWIFGAMFFILIAIFALTKEYVDKRQRLWVRISIAYLTLMAIGVLLVFYFY